jgi:hypothetical protein
MLDLNNHFFNNKLMDQKQKIETGCTKVSKFPNKAK